MYTIKENIVSEYEIKKSRFITLLYKISKKEDVNNIIQEVKNIYKGATHYCYAYLLNEEYHFSDDGEPGGTAGLPILEALKKNNITNVLCIVVRYFGGIKLGAGGLVRAYTKSVVVALEKVQTVELIDGYYIKLETTYDNTKKLEILLNKDKIVTKEFTDKAIYYVEIEKNQLETLHNYDYEILDEIKIEKDI